MDIRQCLGIIQKRLGLIICVTVLATVLTAVISTNIMKTVYEVSSTLYIINQKSNSEKLMSYEDVLTNQQLVKDYRELIKSKLVTKAVIEDLQIRDLTPETLSQRITVKSKNETRVLEISVQDGDPVRAKELSDKISQVLIKKTAELLMTNNIVVVDSAEIPIEPVKPKPFMYTVIVFFISIMAAAGIIILVEYLNDTIKTSEDIETLMEVNVLGTIPKFNIG